MPDLEPISKEQLYTEKEQLHTENIALKEQVTHLQFQLSQVNRLLFGQKRERFEPTQAVQQATLFSLQGSLQEENAVANPAGQVNTEIVKKKGQIAGKPNPNHP